MKSVQDARFSDRHVRQIDQHSPRASIFPDSLLLVKFLRLFYARRNTLHCSLQADANMEGKQTRFGTESSTL